MWSALAADLVNTRPRPASPAEGLDDDALAALLARCPGVPPPLRRGDLTRAREVRGRLLDAFTADDLEAFAAAVNPLLARAPLQVVPAGGAWALDPAAAARAPDWLGAHAARGLTELVLARGLDRLHACAADDCQQVLADVSRNGARRFCSRTCANRTNVRRFRAHRPG